jgi:hypothetical protein
MTKTFIYFLFASFFGTIEPVGSRVNLARIKSPEHQQALAVFRIA